MAQANLNFIWRLTEARHVSKGFQQGWYYIASYFYVVALTKTSRLHLFSIYVSQSYPTFVASIRGCLFHFTVPSLLCFSVKLSSTTPLRISGAKTQRNRVRSPPKCGRRYKSASLSGADCQPDMRAVKAAVRQASALGLLLSCWNAVKDCSMAASDG